MWIISGLAALGFLIGNLVGLTASSVVTPLLGLLFAFAGGSVLGLLHKINDRDRQIAGASLLALSIFCLGGMYLGILTTQYRWLSPPASKSEALERGRRTVREGEAERIDGARLAGIKTQDAYELLYRLALKYEEHFRAGVSARPGDPYIKSAHMGKADAIDRNLQAGVLKLEDAYQDLYGLVLEYENQLRGVRSESRIRSHGRHRGRLHVNCRREQGGRRIDSFDYQDRQCSPWYRFLHFAERSNPDLLPRDYGSFFYPGPVQSTTAFKSGR